jgi:hypothetical protein
MAVIAAAFGAMVLTGSARAQDDSAMRSDLRCVVSLQLMADKGDEKMKAASLAATLYFLGRIDGRSPDADLESLLAAELKTMSPADMQTSLVRCGQILVEKGTAWQSMGERMLKGGIPQEAS